MKIAIVTPGGVDRSGTERVIPCLLWLIERLAKAGHEVHVFALSQEPARGTWPLLGARVHNAGRPMSALSLLRMLRSEHKRGRFEIIHAWWAIPSGVLGAIASKLLRVPMVLTLPGGDLSSIEAIAYGSRRRAINRLRLRVALSGARVVTVPSDCMRAEAHALGIEAERVPFGVALDRWPPREPRPRDPAAPLRLLHVASLNRVKDQPTLLRACAALERRRVRYTLDIVGEDALDGAMQRLAAELSLRNVRFTGFRPHSALRAFYERADLLVVSSLHETGPMVLLEAAVAGVPTVGTAVGHVADYAPDAALAVAAGDSKALAAAIRRVAGRENLRLELAWNAHWRALAENADMTARLFEQAYARARAGSASAVLRGAPA